MHNQKIPLSDTQAFNSFFLDYINQNPSLKKFYNRFPTLENFKDQLKEKSASFPVATRHILTNTLSAQYKNLNVSDRVKRNIDLLKDENTYTITTGHQLNIFTGPLYFIYKIVTVINTCKNLKATYPEYNFIPIYWMATEDHDFEEIKYIRLYGEKYIWNTTQTGAVGRFDTHSINELLNELPGNIDVFKEAYLNSNTLADAVRCYVNELFGNEGLVALDGDSRELKSLFKEVIKDDLTNHSTKKLVNETDDALAVIEKKTQVNVRDVNFFFLDNNLRNRIERQGDKYYVVDTDRIFTKDDIHSLIDTNPEMFSPNVILRPLYEEMVLPNLAYIGGPAEVIYWLQLKGVFNYFKITFPIVMPRNFAMVMDQPTIKKFAKLKLELKNIFLEKNQLYKHWVLKNSQHDLQVQAEMNTIEQVFEKLKNKSAEVDQTLIAFVAAESKRAKTSLSKIEQKLIRAEKRLQSEKLNQIEFLKERLFPGGSLQERVDNFLNFYQADPEFIQKLLACFDPLDFEFNILSYK